MTTDTLHAAAERIHEAADKAMAQPKVEVRVEGVWLNSRFYMAVDPHFMLAVADWLDEAVDHLAVSESDELGDPCPTAVEGLDCSVLGQALTVAQAYLKADPA